MEISEDGIKNLSKEELERCKKRYGNDNIFFKEVIKYKLLHNQNIISAINNAELDPEETDNYFNENILPYYFITETQTEVKNYVCYETGFLQVSKYNHIMKQGQITFYILCHIKDIYDEETGLARHDLIASLIEREFNWCTDFGTQLRLVSDKPYAVDNNYVLRTLVFEQETPNGIVDPITGQLVTDSR